MKNEQLLSVGQKAPEFSLKNQNGEEVSLKDFKGKWAVLYFYPKDNTPGCTIEAIAFTKYMRDFEKLNTAVIGVSPDSCQSHVRFVEKHKLGIFLLSDTEHGVLVKYGVWQQKSMFGKKYMGVYRSTFLISPEGKIACIWYGVNVAGHVEDVLEKVSEIG